MRLLACCSPACLPLLLASLLAFEVFEAGASLGSAQKKEALHTDGSGRKCCSCVTWAWKQSERQAGVKNVGKEWRVSKQARVSRQASNQHELLQWPSFAELQCAKQRQQQLLKHKF